MARPPKQRVDWFEHDANASRSNTCIALKNLFGDAGYAFWFYLLESLASSDGMYLDCSKPDQWIKLKSKTELTDEDVKKCLDMLATLNAIDEYLWKDHRIIWCENFLKRANSQLKRRVGKITIPIPIPDGKKKGVRVEESVFGPVAVDQLVCYVEGELSMTGGNLAEMQDFRDILGDDLIRWAVDESVAANVREWRYTRKILQSMIAKNVKSVGEAKALKAKKDRERERGQTADRPIRWVD